MDRIEEALWTQVRLHFPDRAEVVHADDRGFVVSWLADDDPARPHQRAQNVSLRVDKALRDALSAASHIELERIAVNAGRLVQNAMHRYPDKRDAAFAFIIELGDSLTDR